MIVSLKKELYTRSGIYIMKSLVDARVYIGSAVFLNKRRNRHCEALRKGVHHNVRLQHFFNKYGTESLEFDLLELCEKESLVENEQKWIDFFLGEGFTLFNLEMKAGSSLGYKHRPETIEKLKCRTHSVEAKKKMSDQRKGVPQSEELKKKLSVLLKGRPKSDEWKKKMSVSMKGNQNGKGKKQTPEHIASRITKSTEANTGRKLTQQHKEKIGQRSPFKGVKRSEEYKAKMSVLVTEAKARKKAERMRIAANVQ